MKYSVIKKYLNIVIMSLIYACFYSFLETLFKQFNIYCGFDNPIHKFSSFPQFILTMLWTPMFILHKKIKIKYIRLMLYPFNVYMCELFGGFIFLYIFETKIWEYTDRFSLFYGLITLSYYPLWLSLFTFEDYMYWYVKMYIDKKIENINKKEIKSIDK